ncbi:hypothetical protein A3B50_04580 [Candidatus Roizmanbacteria bacterium RIFCSPLOWO2_01_FULL_40_42]|uniref:Uncharacterized protein n=1 Tax=Candidatus Roizmanbacteria bacterium RIFCSPLOWO2_01_FULL_40_42 TaxID=1802066 RepID=A0A1F7J469_9BACT|nr:MAG: hypothetical protein A2779_00025 [Candidatus Roizmanbacteria bacterium RIFCSPHIGHO2_01_FULL_40_98]OGK28482.1 MAG: hypothetical protein A3C31_02800 [Candidatus Roizmanbacteria bacterium RIFCSPHIGHO2_02_FULL_40_53]OGK29373.1 MAG: hypothetical protein A2W49_00550 [Candidatus Roizmanbacteria bacterium RIFCSPHIGHO2_12_41_18]OGK36514.1 MAG: hypothetical protein A3E69_03015 [Candidatus Roizmanbacteria bacterium RIFCSPHIGHO2_12_FULL_40_130]OGK50399.1 MAG: hypothetical protein A3B50_04580 [Candi
MFIERRVDFLGATVKRSTPKPGHTETLAKAPWRKRLCNDQEGDGGLVQVEVLKEGGLSYGVAVKTGHFEVVKGKWPFRTTKEVPTGVRVGTKGKAIGRRRKSGKRISFVFE